MSAGVGPPTGKDVERHLAGARVLVVDIFDHELASLGERETTALHPMREALTSTTPERRHYRTRRVDSERVR